MRFTPSERQREIAERFTPLLGDELAPAVRRLSTRPAGIPPCPADAEARRLTWWAMERLGAVRLAVPAASGGEDGGLADSTVLAELTGRALYQSPLPDTLFALDLLRGHPEARTIAEGATVAVAARDRGDRTLTRPAPLPALDGGDLRIVRRHVAFAAEADLLLIAGTAPDGLRCALLPTDHPGVHADRHEDLACGDLSTVTVEAVPRSAWIGGSPLAEAWAAALTGARTRHAAYLVGLSQAALDLTVEHARTRRQFGQSIGRFQALAFRLAGLATDVEAARMLTGHAASRADEGHGGAAMASLEAVAMAGDVARRAAAEAVQIHGAAGMTDDHDAQLFYRRAAIDAVFLGSPDRHRAEAAAYLTAEPSGPAVCLDHVYA
ncbi:acyl-CoA dehydrogenase family protein [Actinomadura macra]|uniref:acyl-CoA dehydrogenase family protein n=1 Tax=Actinomadura macra TaxID=46164 RepID=UPI00082E7015|nr:acyl-CoA dehydrogenase family protein [Actinomadura macra]